jgi:hypothetical protein
MGRWNDGKLEYWKTRAVEWRADHQGSFQIASLHYSNIPVFHSLRASKVG